MATAKVKWTVTLEDGYIRVYHSKLGLICAGCFSRDGRIVDISFDKEEHRRSNMIRMPAMAAIQRWENSILDTIIDGRGCSRDTARVHAGWTRGVK